MREVSRAFQAEGFDVVSTLDVAGYLARHAHHEHRRYMLLEALMPQLTLQAMQYDPAIGPILATTIAIYELATVRRRSVRVRRWRGDLDSVGAPATRPSARSPIARTSRSFGRSGGSIRSAPPRGSGCRPEFRLPLLEDVDAARCAFQSASRRAGSVACRRSFLPGSRDGAPAPSSTADPASPDIQPEPAPPSRSPRSVRRHDRLRDAISGSPAPPATALRRTARRLSGPAATARRRATASGGAQNASRNNPSTS